MLFLKKAFLQILSREAFGATVRFNPDRFYLALMV